MKTKEEIEQLKLEIYRDIQGGIGGDYGFFSAGFNIAYTQCQEDMADKKYTEQDIRKAIILSCFATALLGVILQLLLN
jgi:hypothetical protein